MIVAGVMSGTSADGIDVAIVLIRGRGRNLHLRLLGHEHFPYPRAVRKAILAAMNANSARVADLARLNFLLGGLYADAVDATRKRYQPELELIGCHGQTLYHQSEASAFLGRSIATTWQTGEASVIAGRTAVPVVSDFRVADMAAGGAGAPLVPLLDLAFYGHRKKLRVLQNIGGIANLTILPPRTSLAAMECVVAFDTGPGNMVIDACAQELFAKPYDDNGRIAAKGTVIRSALKRALQDPFFRLKPPKTAGREQFGREFTKQFLKWCGARAKKPDVLATATALTAVSIGQALRRALATAELKPPFARGTAEYVFSGGGSQNRTLTQMISHQVEPLGFRVLNSDDLGIPSQAKEAVAFALLAYHSWHRLPGNVPSATGATRPAVLGKISYP